LNFIGAARGSVGQTVNHDNKVNKDLALTKEKESARVQSGNTSLINLVNIESRKNKHDSIDCIIKKLSAKKAT
jgi:hypothetical protein